MWDGGSHSYPLQAWIRALIVISAIFWKTAKTDLGYHHIVIKNKGIPMFNTGKGKDKKGYGSSSV